MLVLQRVRASWEVPLQAAAFQLSLLAMCGPVLRKAYDLFIVQGMRLRKKSCKPREVCEPQPSPSPSPSPSTLRRTARKPREVSAAALLAALVHSAGSQEARRSITSTLTRTPRTLTLTQVCLALFLLLVDLQKSVLKYIGLSEARASTGQASAAADQSAKVAS